MGLNAALRTFLIIIIIIIIIIIYGWKGVYLYWYKVLLLAVADGNFPVNQLDIALELRVCESVVAYWVAKLTFNLINHDTIHQQL